MIVSDRHKVIFIHIPKCAGTTVRRALQPHDDTGGRFDRRIEPHDGLGPVDMTHLPLDLMAQLAPEEHAKLVGGDYAAYALLRDPFARFPSSVAQRLKMFRGAELAQVDAATLKREIAETIRYLSDTPAGHDPAYIHFRRQSDYALRDGRQVVERLYTLDQIDAFWADIAARTGGAATPETRSRNRTRSLSLPLLRRPVQAASRAVARVLPQAAYRPMRRRARRVLMTDTATPHAAVFASDEIRAFVAAHYAEDIALFERVRDAGPGATAA